MLQHDKADDYVLAMGETHTVRKFVETCFTKAGFNIEWRGEGVNEKGYDTGSGKCLIELSEKYYRPAEVELLLGDSSKAQNILKWKPNTSFEELIDLMLNNDIEEVKKGTQF